VGKTLPADLEAIVLACLAKEREARPASAAALRTALLACQDAPAFDASAARAWWQAHRAAANANPPVAGPPHSRPATMAIDLGGRSTVGQ
jgi:hypothetical protein